MTENTTIKIWREATNRLSPVAREEAAQQARLLLCFVLDTEPARWMEYAQQSWTQPQRERLNALMERRLKGEPLQYILGSWGFMGLDFAVRPGVLIPRQDTETLCERALRLAKEKNYRTVLDMCCGSGCIGIALARLGNLQLTAADISPACLALTRENAQRNAVEVETVQSDLFQNITSRYDLIVCNPPYLSAKDMNALQPEVAQEPALALYGGADGLDYYRRIAAAYKPRLTAGGTLLMEVGMGQAQAVGAMFDGTVRTVKDIAGIDRVVEVHT